MISYVTQLGIFRWFDFFEIALITGIIYRFCIWLKHDRTSFLLGYFYVGCFIFLGAALLNLQAVLEFYRYCWPALLMLFIIMHQKSLQQNYIAARTIEPETFSAEHGWVHIVMRAAFKALQRKKTLTFLIEGKYQLDDYLTKKIVLQSPIQQTLFDMITESSIIEDNSIVLLNQQGTLKAFNCTWQTLETPQTPAPIDQQSNINTVQPNAVQWTSKTDALVFFAQADSKRITIIAQGTIVKDLTSDKAELIIGQYIRKQKFIHKEHAAQQSTPIQTTL